VQAPRHVGGVLAGERDLQRVGRARGVARGEEAPERRLALLELRAERAPAHGEALELGLRGAALGLEQPQLAVGLRDRALGVAQRVARLAAAGFLLAQVVAQRVDAAAQRRQVLLAPALRRQRGRGREQGGEEGALQAFAFPWAETAATRRSISAASPR
jgi:hypothetical protein